MSAFELSSHSFKETELNETLSKDMLELMRPKEGNLKSLAGITEYYEYNGGQILYISDLHLDHFLIRKKCKTIDNVSKVLDWIAKKICKSYYSYHSYGCSRSPIIIIDGDITSSPTIFKIFINKLNDLSKNAFIVLGNHELWAFPNHQINEIVKEYSLLSPIKIIQNEIVIFSDSYKEVDTYSSSYGNEYTKEHLPYEYVMQLSSKELSDKFSKARIIMLAGIGFSGCNQEFNANNGIYRSTLNREEEIDESHRFNDLYNHFLESTKDLGDRVIIVATHMPLECWCENPEYKDGIIYISGHTHRNYFFDDGKKRIYADNQNGYTGNKFTFKCIYLDDVYDPFASYNDGIYEISKAEYIHFNRAKRISMSLNRNDLAIYMLKKRGYYCFLTRLINGDFAIFNGGSIKRIGAGSLEYYFENMDKIIDELSSPLEKYTEFQKKISEKVRLIGGSGEIHGCIVDIDFYNHIFVNSIDFTVTGYYAEDIIIKQVYKSVPALLKEKAPRLYSQYVLLLQDKTESASIKNTLSPIEGTDSVLYLATDIYKMSREIKKTQKLSNNVLSVWYDDLTKAKVFSKREIHPSIPSTIEKA